MGTGAVAVRVTLAHCATPGALAEVPALARAVEAAGAAGFYVAGEPVAIGPPGRGRGRHRLPGAIDPFVVLGAAAAATRRLELACLGAPFGERHPSVLAKSIAALDVISEGRAAAVLSEPDPPHPRLLVEALALVSAMFSEPPVSFSGAHFAVSGAWNEPRAKRTTPMRRGVLLRGTRHLRLLGEVPPPLVCYLGEDALGARAAETVARALSAGAAEVHAVVATEGRTAAALQRLIAELAGAGCAGTVLDITGRPPPEELAALVATL